MEFGATRNPSTAKTVVEKVNSTEPQNREQSSGSMFARPEVNKFHPVLSNEYQ